MEFVDAEPDPSVIDDAIPLDNTASADPTCRVCGIALTYGGRGRKPVLCAEHKGAGARSTGGMRTADRGNSADVDSAIAILDGMYTGLAMGLMMVSPNAASVWAGNVDKLQATNRVTLAADKTLTKRILKFGQRSATATFVGAHVVAIAPVVMVVQQDIAARTAATKAAKTAASHLGDLHDSSGVPPGFF